VAILVPVVIGSILFVYLMGQKEEPLPAQERWQIMDVNCAAQNGHYATYIELKYLGENPVDHVMISTLSAFRPDSGSYWHEIQYLDYSIKGETSNIEMSGYTFDLTIYWDEYVHGDLCQSKAEFEVLPIDESQLDIPPAED
jgi:hypothetical protein